MVGCDSRRNWPHSRCSWLLRSCAASHSPRVTHNPPARNRTGGSGGGPGFAVLPQFPGEFRGGDRAGFPLAAVVVEPAGHAFKFRRGGAVERGRRALLGG